MEYLLFACLLVYLVPWLVAEKRGHPRATRILFVNALAGWTLVGWAGVLWWALRQPGNVPAPRLRLVRGGLADEDGTQSRPPRSPTDAARRRKPSSGARRAVPAERPLIVLPKNGRGPTP